MDGLTWKVVFEYRGLTIQGPQSRDWRMGSYFNFVQIWNKIKF